MNQTTSSPGRVMPIVPYLVLPTDSKESPYLLGSRCRKCGEMYLGSRAVCVKCFESGCLDELKLGGKGELFAFTVIYQSAPWVTVPYVAAVVRLAEGPVVRASLTQVEPDPAKLRVGMPLEMITEKVRQTRDGTDVIAYKFRPAAS